MNLYIAGMGWVTPLGSGVTTVWDRLLRGEEAQVENISDPVGQRNYPVFRVPDNALENLAPHPRLRRASAISRFAAAAGLAALADAKATIAAADPQRIALVLAVSNGGVIYTKRFYRDIVISGVQTASPLLFPETVFNAPASHLAAILGITGTSYTIVGDGAVGLVAVKMAEDLMTNEALDYCLVVGAEEADWILCDAYRKWRLVRAAPPIEPFHKPPRGMILSEGAGAVLLGRKGAIEIERTDGGGYYTNQRQAGEGLRRILSGLASPESALVVTSANGTFIDQAEASAVSKVMPDVTLYTPKPALGESVGASSLWQLIVAAQALRTGQCPPLLHSREFQTRKLARNPQRALVLSCGLNQQFAGLRLAI